MSDLQLPRKMAVAAVVGIELDTKDDFKPLVDRMTEKGFLGEYLNENPELFQFLI